MFKFKKIGEIEKHHGEYYIRVSNTIFGIKFFEGFLDLPIFPDKSGTYLGTIRENREYVCGIRHLDAAVQGLMKWAEHNRKEVKVIGTIELN